MSLGQFKVTVQCSPFKEIGGSKIDSHLAFLMHYKLKNGILRYFKNEEEFNFT